ncbi:hypothetical protein BCR43DRAFT_480876 [Syncephalastrum racemosum]|uniref:NodB homology domain-containing protein n=1 Tax=Syncephalastrum racemosum TaxID=13706 RepID=A0A1X2H0E0_SYNRA|nr:hypothetical protein BCR43DRAFT_480876 [Syncephalastrum racemosum]
MRLTTTVIAAAAGWVWAAVAVHAEILENSSPVWLADVAGPTDPAIVAQEYPKDESVIQNRELPGPYPLDISTYPKPLQPPPTDHPEVQKVVSQLDWSKVPQIQPRTIKVWAVDISGYDAHSDPDCWWSASTCKRPKLDYLPEDIYTCPNAGDWGLNYDDGPLRIWSFNETQKAWQEPHFYNFLVDHGKQKATLFFIGSNVITFPEAAQRALSDGHTICAHTWSHKQMTTLTNEEIVAEFYWTSKAIKEVMGITPKCWRPPYGDVDDRVRAIAWLMGMRTVIWDQDSNDWNLYGTPARGSHENSNSTVSMAERWLPKLQEAFRVMPIHKCIDDPYPYWEKAWAYPTLKNADPPLDPKAPESGQTSEGEAGSKSHGSNHADGPSASAASHLFLPLTTLLLAALSFFTF